LDEATPGGPSQLKHLCGPGPALMMAGRAEQQVGGSAVNLTVAALVTQAQLIQARGPHSVITKESEKPEASSPSDQQELHLQKCAENGNFPAAFINHVIEFTCFIDQLFWKFNRKEIFLYQKINSTDFSQVSVWSH